LCLGAFAAYAHHRYRTAACLAAFAVLTRPEGLLVAGLLVVDFLVRRGKPHSHPNSHIGRISLTSCLLFLGILLPWLLFAWSYFGSPVPATLAAKQHQGLMAISQRFAPGLLTVMQPYARLWYFWVEAALVVLGIGWAAWMLIKGISHPGNQATRRPGDQLSDDGHRITDHSVPDHSVPDFLLLFLAWPVLHFVAYTVLGVSRYFWYYAPLVPGWLVLVGLGLSALKGIGKKSAIPLYPTGNNQQSAIWFLLLLLFAAQVFSLWQKHNAPQGRASAYEAVGEWLKENTTPSASVATLEAGIIGYYSERPIVDFSGLLQPAVAAQLHPESTYQDAARWAIEQYRPEYVVLHQGVFPELESGEIAKACRLVKQFPGAAYQYAYNLNIYRCYS
jgi:hypothetical protein